MARQMLELEDEVKDICPHTKLFLVQTVAVAKSILATGKDWLGTAQEIDGSVVERWKFERWCPLFGRKVG